MPENRRKRPRDPAQLAKLMIDIASGEVEDRGPNAQRARESPAAVKRGQLGGLHGGKARAQALPEEKRRAISRKAAKARWSKVKEPLD